MGMDMSSRNPKQLYICPRFGPIPWLLMGELLPRRSRSLGASLATGTNWAGTFLVTKTFLDLRNSLGAGLVFWMYGVIVGVALVFTMILIPETKGKSLEVRLNFAFQIVLTVYFLIRRLSYSFRGQRNPKINRSLMCKCQV